MKYFLYLACYLLCSPIIAFNTEEFFGEWGTVDNYYEHCISELNDEDIQFLIELADKDGNIYFVVYLDETRVIIPTNIKELVREVD
jgi:hypothetical protein